jgi:hypothetical protein
MAGLVPAIHVFPSILSLQDVDARHKAGHDRVMERARARVLGSVVIPITGKTP